MPFVAQNPVVYNAAAAGFCAGILTRRMQLAEQSLGRVQPSDFLATVTAAFLFAQAVDDALVAAGAQVPTNVQILTTIFESLPATVVPSTSALANAAESVPAAMVFIAKAAWEGRDLPYEAGGVSFTVSDYEGVATYVVALFNFVCANMNPS